MNYIVNEFHSLVESLTTNPKFFIAQVLSIFALLFGVIAFQCRKHIFISFNKSISEGFSAIHYFFLGVYTGMTFAIISAIRNITLAELVKHKKNTLFFQILFSVFYIVMGIITWEGILGLMVIIAKVISSVSYGIKKEKIFRIMNAPAVFMWVIYNLIHKSIGCTISDSLSFISIIIAIIRYDILKHEKTNTKTNNMEKIETTDKS